MKNIEKMMKFCSKLGEVFEHPYFFNWSPPTNHRDNAPEGEISDVNYVIFRVGMYLPTQTATISGVEFPDSRARPIEKQLMFAHTSRIVDFTPFISLMFNGEVFPHPSGYPIKNFDDLETHKEQLKYLISEFLNKNNDGKRI